MAFFHPLTRLLIYSPSSHTSLEPARFAAKYKTTEARIEERAQLHCTSTGEQPIGIEWFDKDGKPVKRDDKRLM